MADRGLRQPETLSVANRSLRSASWPIHLSQLVFDTGATCALGFCAGRACRAAGDTAAVGIGGAVVLLGGLAKAGYITVDIPKIEKQVLTTYHALGTSTTYYALVLLTTHQYYLLRTRHHILLLTSYYTLLTTPRPSPTPPLPDR